MSLKFPDNWLNNICNKFAMNPKANVVVICMKLRLVTKQRKRHMKASKYIFTDITAALSYLISKTFPDLKYHRDWTFKVKIDTF